MNYIYEYYIVNGLLLKTDECVFVIFKRMVNDYLLFLNNEWVFVNFE